MARGGADSPALPVELCGHVASFLSLRESCVLASTCRALWAMDLLSLKVVHGQREWELLNDGDGGFSAPGGATSALLCN